MFFLFLVYYLAVKKEENMVSLDLHFQRLQCLWVLKILLPSVNTLRLFILVGKHLGKKSLIKPPFLPNCRWTQCVKVPRVLLAVVWSEATNEERNWGMELEISEITRSLLQDFYQYLRWQPATASILPWQNCWLINLVSDVPDCDRVEICMCWKYNWFSCLNINHCASLFTCPPWFQYVTIQLGESWSLDN